MPDETLKDKTARGLLWGGLSNGAQQVLNLVFGILISRRLTPAEYGMVGMLTIFSLVSGSLVESGFINALAKKKTVEHRDYNAVFWCCLTVSIALYALLFACAPLIARFFHHEELIALSRFLFTGFVISSLAVVPTAIFFRELKIRQKATAQVMALAVSGTAGVIMAYSGMSYWGLATQTVSYVTVFTLIMWLFTSWRPTLNFDMAPVRAMFGFSSKLLVTNVFQHINNNVFSLLLGRWYTSRDVGNYTQANKWTIMGHSLIANMISGVAMPVFASVSDDRERLLGVFRKMLRFAAFVSFPLMFGLSLVAEEFITIAITERWLSAAHLMRLLGIWGAFVPITTTYVNLIISDGRSRVYMQGTVVLGLLQMVQLFLMRHQGLTTMMVAYIVLYVAWLLYWHYWAHRITGITLLQALKDIAPFALAAAVAMGAAYAATIGIGNIGWRMAAKMVCAAAVYIGIMRMTNAVVMKESLSYLLKKKTNV